MRCSVFNGRNPASRFWPKVNKTDTCWFWTSVVLQRGYGQFSVNGRKVMAHRWAYEDVYGPIPDGLTIDHLCRNRDCVRPLHLEAVTNAENIRRGIHRNTAKTRCIRGHSLSGDNLYTTPDNRRQCRTCRQTRDRRILQRRMQERHVV